MIDDIWIVCDDHSHPTKTVRIDRMMKDSRGWTSMGFVLARDDRVAKEAARSRGVVRGIAKRTKSDDTYDQPKHNLRCSLCGYEVRATLERLAPVLDTLAANEVSRITLRAVDARLAKQ